jgi:hypothetical protein
VKFLVFTHGTLLSAAAFSESSLDTQPTNHSGSEHGAAAAAASPLALTARSVGNSAALAATALVEAFNLKAAVEFSLGNVEGARAALTDMPPRWVTFGFVWSGGFDQPHALLL